MRRRSVTRPRDVLPPQAGAAPPSCCFMYPPVTQFETRRQELERELQAIQKAEPRRPADAQPARPPRYKMALLTWVGAYALITAVLAVLGPAMAAWPLMLRTLLLSVTMVVVLTWLMLPGLTRLFRRWLAPTG